MSALQAEVYQAFLSLEVEHDIALRAAVALSAAMSKGEEDTMRNLKRVEDDAAKSFSKRDADIEATRKDASSIKDQLLAMRLDIASVKSEQAIMRWMMGFLLAMMTTVLFRVFTH